MSDTTLIRAVIDVGTQSTNLLVGTPDGSTLYRQNAATRLGEDLHATGRLSTVAMDRTLDVIVQHLATASEHGATDVIITGTAACRRASNTAEFQALVREKTGHTLEVLSEKDEAHYAFLGATASLPPVDGPTLVIDIGGGSTEYIIGFSSGEMSASIPFGAVTSTSSHIATDPPKPEDLTNLIGAVADELEEIGRDMPALLTPARVVGVAGTIVTIAAVEIGLQEFDEQTLNGFVLTKDAAEDVFRTLATEAASERAMNPGLGSHRVDIIVAGCCILVATMRRLHIDEIVVSTHNLMDGLMKRERI